MIERPDINLISERMTYIGPTRFEDPGRLPLVGGRGWGGRCYSTVANTGHASFRGSCSVVWACMAWHSSEP